MAGKSRVGALYFEMILDPKGYRQGTKKVVADHKKMEKELAQAGRGVNGRTKADAQLKAAKETSKRLYMQGKITLDQARALRRAAVLNHKHSMAKIVSEEKQASEKTLRILRKAKDEKARIVRAESAVVEKENARLDKKYKAYLAHRHAVQRKWNRRKVANEKEAAAKIAAIRKASFAGGMFGTGSAAMGLGAVTSGFQKFTSALFPVAIAFYAISRAMRRVFRGFKAWVKAADTMKKQLLVLTTLMHGNEEMATKLRNSLVAYAKATSFSVEQTMQLAIQMKALGFTAQEIPSLMAKLGRLSFGDGAKLKLIAKAYSDVRAQGKLLMTEVRQFANQGVPLLAQLQINLGKTALEVRDDMKAGLIGFEDVKKAIDDIAESYGNVDTAGLATVGGQMEAAAEAWNEILAKTGKSETLLNLAKGLNRMLAGIDKLVGNTALLDKTLKAVEYWVRSIMFAFTMGLSEVFIWANRFVDWASGMKAVREAETAELERQAELEKEKVKRKREELEIARKLANMAAAQDQHSTDTMNTEARFDRMRLEAQAQLDSNAQAQLDILDAQIAREEKNREAKKRYDDEKNAIIAERDKAGGTDTEAYKKWKKDLEAEYQARYEMEMRLQDDIDNAKAQKDLNDERAEQAKALADAELEAAEKKRKMEEEWRKQDLEDAKKMIRLAEEAQAKFVKDQAEANKFKDMGPQTAPSFQANSVAEFTFRKEKELQRDKQREENRREAERREHAEILNEQVVDAINGLGLDGADQAELNFQGVGE
jgi:tape measure domain-containing protein